MQGTQQTTLLHYDNILWSLVELHDMQKQPYHYYFGRCCFCNGCYDFSWNGMDRYGQQGTECYIDHNLINEESHERSFWEDV